jgi:ABC-type nickel/cobalt efflux system permease component RcnA
MPDIATIIQAGAQNPWHYLPAALLLGALHALEPGPSKSIMDAFIIGELVSIDIAAAWAGRKAAAHKNPAFSAAAHWLPYASTVIVIAVGSFISLRGLHGLGVLGA